MLLMLLFLQIQDKNLLNVDDSDLKLFYNDAPLVIVNNTDLATKASSGSGIWGDPYIIENLTINASGSGGRGILIQDTDKPFILRNCTVSDADKWHDGIFLFFVKNAQIINNTVNNNGDHGIYLLDSEDIMVINNTVNFNYKSGLYLERTENVTILNNTFKNDNLPKSFGAPYGIGLTQSDNNTVANNTINNNNIGIDLFYSDLNIISNNTINDNTKYGIDMENAHNNNITWNTLHGNLVCINVYLSVGNIIENNSCQNRVPTSPPPPIPGFTWIYITLGLIAPIILIVMFRHRGKVKFVK